MTDQFDGLKSVQLYGHSGPKEDVLAVEEPLEIRVEGRSVAVVLRTPGIDPIEDLNLVTGFLLTEGVVDDIDDIQNMAHCTDSNRPHGDNVVNVSLAMGMGRVRDRIAQAERQLFVGSSCGVCGKATIDRVFQAVNRWRHRYDCPMRCAFTAEPSSRSPRTIHTNGWITWSGSVLHRGALIDGRRCWSSQCRR